MAAAGEDSQLTNKGRNVRNRKANSDLEKEFKANRKAEMSEIERPLLGEKRQK